MRRLGLFLGFTPKQLVPHEGIARLVGFIVHGAVSAGDVSITIAAPSWLKPEILALLEDANVPSEKVEIVTTKGKPFIVRIWEIVEGLRRKNKQPPVQRWRIKKIGLSLARYVLSWLTTTSITLFLVGAILLTATATVIFLPVLVLSVFLATYLMARLSLPLLSRSRAGKYVKAGLVVVKRMYRIIRVVDLVQDRELKRLVNDLNRRADVDVWYVPSMFWPQVGNLRGKIVMAAPDIVFYEHPAQYSADEFAGGLERITQSIEAADHLICYSDYVKNNHIVKRQNVPAEVVSVIRHGAIDTSRIEAGVGDKFSALDVLNRYLSANKHRLPAYLAGFDFEDVDFLFYSSQARHHKNIEGLIAVYEKILRNHFRPVKLILTARQDGSARLRDFVVGNGLKNDVLFLSSIPNDVLAALYRLSLLSVTPTMFEGGFPFTFTEAYSVGTPSVMSRIPVVTEVIKDPVLLEKMTFDPRDRQEMLEKILWGIDNRHELLEAQRPLFNSMQSRSWTKVADEYVSLMRRVGDEQP